MTKARLEAFSDGVLAIIITIMVLELPRPGEHDPMTWEFIRQAAMPVGMYLLSFVLVGIYWNNHHHLMHAVDHINGTVLWANLHLLFWLSLVPYLTDLMSHGGDLMALPAALYGVVLLCAGTAYRILVTALLRAHNPRLKAALGSDVKGWASIVIYAVAVALARWLPWFSIALYAAVAIIWLVPDRRIERHVTHPSA